MTYRNIMKIALLSALMLCGGSFAIQPVLAQNNVFLKSEKTGKKAAPTQNPAAPAAKKGTAVPQQQTLPSVTKCTKAELEAFMKVDNIIMGNARYAEEAAKKGLSESEAEEFAKEMQGREQKIQELMKRPGFIEKYGELSIRCHKQAQALKNK